MIMSTEKLINRVNSLIELSNKIIEGAVEKNHNEWVDSAEMVKLRSASLSFISSVYTENHIHYEEFKLRTKATMLHDAETARSILYVIKDEIEGGWLSTTRSLISAELFSSFLDMAKYFLTEGYKDPAAVIGGGVLEEHLRELCSKNEIPTEIEKSGKLTPKKADLLNSELAKSKVTNKLDQKAVTNWLGLRNDAAHGNYDNYNEEQVRIMIQGITEFITRTSS